MNNMMWQIQKKRKHPNDFPEMGRGLPHILLMDE